MYVCVCGWMRAQIVVQCHGSAGQAVGLAGPPPLSMALFISLQTQIGLLASESGQGRSAASLWQSFMQGFFPTFMLRHPRQILFFPWP